MKFLTSKAVAIIEFSYLLLVLFTPLLFYSQTYELFEFNKMMFVYLMTIIIATFWAVRMVEEKRWLWQNSPLDLPIALFLLANILSTIFSIDRHVSIFGYYSRLNGGLLSILSYSILYWAFLANFPRERIKQLLGAVVLGGLLVAAWAIPEHFGIDPSCKLLVDSWKATCWVQDVQARVFATLGQPNWLAAYLGMVIPVSLGLLLHEKNQWLKLFYLLSTLSMVLATIFTYSRGGLLGLAAGMVVFGLLLLVNKKRLGLPKLQSGWRYLTIVAIITTAMAAIFGTAFSKPLLLSENRPIDKPNTEATKESEYVAPQPTAESEPGRDETGQIRLIVWKGAVDIWKNYPLFGSGVETFAYSYYQHRPLEHNQTTEWDFLYNKAHNEYLNYLATTGSFGFITYLFLIASMFGYAIWKLWTSTPFFKLIIIGLLGGIASYLVQNTFGFSIVVIALFFFLYPAIAFKIINTKEEPINLPNFFRLPSLKINNPFAQDRSLGPLFLLAIFTVSGLSLFFLGRMYAADLKFNQGLSEGTSLTGKYLLEQAVILNPLEPFYQAELGYVNATLAVEAATDKEAEQFRLEAEKWGQQAVASSPMAMPYWRTLFRTYSELMVGFEGYEEKTLEVAKKAVELAPTDPKTLHNLANLYHQLGKNEEALQTSLKVKEFKPEYREAYLIAARSYEALGKRDDATKMYRETRKRFPREVEARNMLVEWTGKDE